MLEVLLAVLGSNSVAVAVAVLRNWPEPSMCAVTVTVTLAPEASEEMVHVPLPGNGFGLNTKFAHPPPLIDNTVRPIGASFTRTSVAASGPAFDTARFMVM